MKIAISNKEPSYTLLNYLQSTGTQILDSEILGSNDLIIECLFERTGSTYNGYFGCSGISSNANAGRNYLTRNTSGFGTQNTTISPEIVLNAQTLVKKDGNLTYVNGTLVTTHSVSTFTSINPIGLFGTYNGTTYKASIVLQLIKCWYFKITRKSTGEVLKDFIPVLDGSNVPCMYDKISKTFHYNQGTGSFLYG